MAHPTDWSLWRSFLAVVETGSLSAAARRIGSTQPTVGRQIAALEAALGQKLFLRGRDGLVLQDTALPLVAEARAMALSAAALERLASAGRGALSGTVRIAASHAVASGALPLALSGFLAAHPDIEAEIVASNSNADLLGREADIALRMQRPAQGSLYARKLANVALGLYAHERYIARAGAPETAADLAAHLLIGPDSDGVADAVIRVLGHGLTRRSFRLRSDSEAAQMAALRAGLGIGICQRNIARREAGLTEVLPGRFALSLECWLVTHPDLRAIPRIRSLADHLADRLPALLSG